VAWIPWTTQLLSIINNVDDASLICKHVVNMDFAKLLFKLSQLHMNNLLEIQNEYISKLELKERKFYDTFVDKDVALLKRSSETKQGTEEWLNLRKPILTGSNFSGAIGWSSYVSSKKAMVKKMCYEKFKGNTATRYGNRMESKACKQFEFEQRELIWKGIECAKMNNLSKIKYAGHVFDIPEQILLSENRASDKELFYVFESGLVIHPIFKWLGGSPDGIIYLFGKAIGLLEIKCPYSRKYPYPMIPLYYYGQVLGGCFVMNFKFQYFYVWSPEVTSLERFDFDEELWNDYVFPKLADYYFNFLLFELTIMKEKSSSKNESSQDDQSC